MPAHMPSMKGSSPLTRGKLFPPVTPSRRRRLIPAHAGKTPAPAPPTPSQQAHPRSRGENINTITKARAIEGSSPLTRGKHRPAARRCTAHGLIPAHAGKTLSSRQRSTKGGAHPRSRGENQRIGRTGRRGLGSSPLTRGKRTQSLASLPSCGLIPAHAGKTRQKPAMEAKIGAHPRSRGENLVSVTALLTAMGSSPLTRGKHGERSDVGPRRGLIPAHAGKTLRKVLQRQHLGAHPRSRGENRQAPDRRQQRSGSSPLTRGKPLPCGRSGRSIWLIPAHAGKTSASPWT